MSMKFKIGWTDRKEVKMQVKEMIQFCEMKKALEDFGIYELLASKVKNQRELLAMFRDDFNSLVNLCMEGD